MFSSIIDFNTYESLLSLFPPGREPLLSFATAVFWIWWSIDYLYHLTLQNVLRWWLTRSNYRVAVSDVAKVSSTMFYQLALLLEMKNDVGWGIPIARTLPTTRYSSIFSSSTIFKLRRMRSCSKEVIEHSLDHHWSRLYLSPTTSSLLLYASILKSWR